MEAAEQQVKSKIEELKQHQELVSQQGSDLVQLRQEHAQSVTACDQLHADAVAATEREAALRAQGGRHQDQLANAQEQLAGEMRKHTLYLFSALLTCCCKKAMECDPSLHLVLCATAVLVKVPQVSLS